MSSDAETTDDQRYQDCEGCGEPVDTLKTGIWKAPNDEQWWHEGCYDKLDELEAVRDKIVSLIVPETEDDGLSDEFHDFLDGAQSELSDAIRRERLVRDQKRGGA